MPLKNAIADRKRSEAFIDRDKFQSLNHSKQGVNFLIILKVFNVFGNNKQKIAPGTT